MDTDHVFSYKENTNWKHQKPNYTKTRSTRHDLHHHLKPKCKETYRHWFFESVPGCSTERLHTLSGNPKNVLWNWYGTNTYLFGEAPDGFFWNRYDILTTSSQWILVIAIVIFLHLETYSQYTLICSTEQIRKIYGTYHKTVAADPVFHSTLPTQNIQFTHTTNCPNTNQTGVPTTQ